MALPNYAPEGTIRFGSVPWDDGYANVRLYSSLEQQLTDISSLMTISSDNYSYIGRNRRLKVAIPADRLYHCNYCMYLNSSVTSGYIYCFVRDVQYVNDGTSEISIETDVFQTYLYNVDWAIPPCFIERETTPSEDSKYLFTNEPDFPLTYVVDDYENNFFTTAGYVVFTCSDPEQNSNLVEDIINPTGWYAKPAPVHIYKGIPNGAAIYYCPVDTTSGGSESLELLLNGLNYAGSTESVVSVISVPSFAIDALDSGFQEENTKQDSEYVVTESYGIPARGNTVDGYTPRNSKLLYYPYTYLNLTDYNGSDSEIRYELLGSQVMNLKYAVSPACRALVYPGSYRGATGYDAGITIPCGALGSWNNNAFNTWMAQNSGSIGLTIVGAALAGVAGAATIGAASAALLPASMAIAGTALGASTIGNAVGSVAQLGATAMNASKQPTTTRGQTDFDTLFATGIQGFGMQKVCVKAEIAEQIDEFFDRFGYAVERIETVNITSRPAWNYVKTGGSSPRSLNGGTSATAPFTRGAGTPAEALDLIRRCFDRGITFWHTTTGFGDYSADNSL